jgi:hypothetical protein
VSVWITTENISDEAWRLLLEFANIDFAFAEISKKHGTPENNSVQENYKKQAEQIRVSILQSKEYFDAAVSASLFTSPNHLYYGMVALASAIMLLNGSGEQSLDRLRIDPRNRSHGLNFKTGVTKNDCHHGLSILGKSFVEVAPTGFFLNWYKTLPLDYSNYAVIKRREEGVIVHRRQKAGAEKIRQANRMVGTKSPLLNLLSRLPDMYGSLNRYGHPVVASRADYGITVDMYAKVTTHEWRIHGAPSPQGLYAILQNFKLPYSVSQFWKITDYENKTGCIVTFAVPHTIGTVNFQWPSVREDLNNESIIYSEYIDTHEIVDGYRAAYGLSMLSRYYPDLWIRCLDSHCMAAKAIEHFVFVMTRKFLLMSLQHLAGGDFVISNHIAPWYH